jgi:hypothetical protein
MAFLLGVHPSYRFTHCKLRPNTEDATTIDARSAQQRFAGIAAELDMRALPAAPSVRELILKSLARRWSRDWPPERKNIHPHLDGRKEDQKVVG